MVNINIKLKQPDFGFEATDAYGNTVSMDTSPETGGNNFGARPMQMLLMGLGGCSGIDMVSILKKQRQEIAHFQMHINGERAKETDPSLWENVHIIFELGGKVDPDKAQRAAQLSMEKYCSVAETLRRAGCQITWEVKMV
jgi:putative redox protein